VEEAEEEEEEVFVTVEKGFVQCIYPAKITELVKQLPS
jgi:hypothetical protein